MKAWQILLAAAVLSSLSALTGCTNFLSSSSVSRTLFYVDDGVEEPDDFPILRASGYAVISLQKGPSATQKNLQAMRASKLDAYRELTEQVYGVYIKGSSSQSRSIESRDQVSAEVDGIIHGARVVRQYPLGDSYITELELDTKVLYDLYQMRGAL